MFKILKHIATFAIRTPRMNIPHGYTAKWGAVFSQAVFIQVTLILQLAFL